MLGSVKLPVPPCMLFAKTRHTHLVAASSVNKSKEGMDKSMDQAMVMTMSPSTVQADCISGSWSA